MAAKAKSFSKTFVWIIVGLLIIGLAGFGATNLSGTIRTIGHVGDQPISVDAYARELQREMRAISAQTGQQLPMSQVRALGLDQVVLARLVQLAALDHETSELGVSVGDANLQREIVEIPAFQGINGQFDRETYRFALESANLSETEFEEDLRAESARTLVQSAITSGVRMPDVMADTIADYVGARRSFTWARLDGSALETAIAEPDETQLQAFYDANGDAFMLAETKKLTFVQLTPEMILDSVEVDAAAVRALYDERIAEFDQPERRLVERLVFADEAAAAGAKAQLEVGGTTFEALVQERGLDLGDVDMGDVTISDLDAAADAVFAAKPGDVVGPLPSSLGPALFRVNGVLDARTTEFDDVADELRDELAGDRARRQIESRVEALEDVLAGGATLEELAGETELELGTLDWTPDSGEGIAAYDAFNRAAAAVSDSDFPEIAFLEDGGIFALRLDDTLPRRPQPFADARDAVAEAWRRDQVQQALAEQARGVVADLAASGDFTETGLPIKVENGLMRTAFIDRTPDDFMVQVFEMDKGELRVIPGDGAVLIVRLDDILAPEETGEIARMRAAISERMDQALAQALFAAYARDVQLRARPRIDQRALNAVLASFN